MSNGADARKRTDRSAEFSEGQRIWLLERDFDEREVHIDERLRRMENTLRRISAACIGILTFLVGSLILLVVQLGH